MDIYISFWSEKYERIVTYYCGESFFLGHANTDKLLENILACLSENNFQLDKLLQFSMDGPNVNLTFQKKLNTNLASQRIENVVDTGSCSLHVVQNVLKKSMCELNSDVESFVGAIHQWFKMSSARRENYHAIQDSNLIKNISLHLFIPHVENMANFRSRY